MLSKRRAKLLAERAKHMQSLADNDTAVAKELIEAITTREQGDVKRGRREAHR